VSSGGSNGCSVLCKHFLANLLGHHGECSSRVGRSHKRKWDCFKVTCKSEDRNTTHTCTTGNGNERERGCRTYTECHRARHGVPRHFPHRLRRWNSKPWKQSCFRHNRQVNCDMSDSSQHYTDTYTRQTKDWVQHNRSKNNAEVIQHWRKCEENEPTMYLRNTRHDSRQPKQYWLNQKNTRKHYEFCCMC
jgi:hypothetical protein